MNAAGALIVTSSGGVGLWHSPSSHRGDHLGLGNDGEITLSNGTLTYWNTHTHLASLSSTRSLSANWTMYSPNGECRLIMMATGQMVLQSASYGTLWSSHGAYAPGSSAVMEDNGNLVVTSPSNRVLWASGSLGASATLLLTNAGRAVVESARGQWLWSNP